MVFWALGKHETEQIRWPDPHGGGVSVAYVGLGAFGLLFSAIIVSEMTMKKSVTVLSAFALLGFLFSGLLVFGKG